MAIRKATISSVIQEIGMAELTHNADSRGSQVRSDIKVAQPYVGQGWGIRAGVETDSIVIVDEDAKGAPYIIGYLADDKFYEDSVELADITSIYNSLTKYKSLKEGELVLQSKANSLVFLDESGNISLSTADGVLFELNRTNDSINQISANQNIITEAVNFRNGLVMRDIRTDQEKTDDLFLSSLLALDFSRLENLDIIGADSQNSISDVGGALVGTFDPATGKPSILDLSGISGIPNADKIVQNIKNPAVTEYRLDINEFSDGITGLSIVKNPDSLKQGRLPLNLASRFILGTVVDENGVMPRFDYVFGSGQARGHGDVWKLPGVNDTNSSVDFKVDPAVNILTPTTLGKSSQWISSGISRFNSAIAFQLLLNSRGADNKGNVPDKTHAGSFWSLQVDKEGLTKWNIPASTPLGEQFRNGRSLLWNTDGSITQSVGKEDNTELPNITGGTNDKAKFVNVVPGRRERSWTADYEGSVEWRMGADFAGQSWMVQTDGGHSFYYGKFKTTETSIVDKIATAGLKSPSKSHRRIGTSISGRTEGSVEFDIGANESNNQQSVALNADGMMSITIGEDKVKDSFILNTAGNIKFKVANGGHRFEMLAADSPGTFKNGILLQHGGQTASVIQIDANGVITLRNSAFNSNIIMSAKGDITMTNPAGKISLALNGTISLGGPMAGIDISPTIGVVIRTPAGHINLSVPGKVDIAANTGMTVTGPFSHLQTSGVILGPGGALSPFVVAAIGPGSIDPLTGNAAAVSGFPGIKA